MNKARYEGKVKNAKRQLEEFAELVIAEPGRAFEWADQSFEAAATIEVYSQLLELDEKYHIEALNSAIFQNAGKSSTSQSANLLAAKVCKIAAAELSSLSYK